MKDFFDRSALCNVKDPLVTSHFALNRQRLVNLIYDLQKGRA